MHKVKLGQLNSFLISNFIYFHRKCIGNYRYESKLCQYMIFMIKCKLTYFDKSDCFLILVPDGKWKGIGAKCGLSGRQQINNGHNHNIRFAFKYCPTIYFVQSMCQ